MSKSVKRTTSNGQEALRRELKNIMSRPRATVGARFLDLDAPFDAFDIDKHAKDANLSVFHARYEVDKAARIALSRANFELNSLPEAIKTARKLQTEIDRFINRTGFYLHDRKIISEDDLSIAYSIQDEQDLSTIAYITGIVERIEQLSKLRNETKDDLTISRPSPSRSDPLARHFICALRATFISQKGSGIYQKSINGRSGAFVGLLADAWRSAKFGRQETDLEDALGQKNEFIASNPSEFDASKYSSKLGLIDS
ncbi:MULTISPECIES: hypothetical protein [unclassified Methylobacterium]|uniref:hypothetical protein n=1 Tax=unclassified Methylobacterium TaxID=2615210 RepID=UPI002269D543|nr:MULTISPECIES: hypothetical protein [unclassified Methylobacterium]